MNTCLLLEQAFNLLSVLICIDLSNANRLDNHNRIKGTVAKSALLFPREKGYKTCFPAGILTNIVSELQR